MIANERQRRSRIAWIEWVPLGLLVAWVGIRAVT